MTQPFVQHLEINIVSLHLKEVIILSFYNSNAPVCSTGM